MRIMALLTPSVFHMLTSKRIVRLLYPVRPDLYFTTRLAVSVTRCEKLGCQKMAKPE